MIHAADKKDPINKSFLEIATNIRNFADKINYRVNDYEPNDVLMNLGNNICRAHFVTIVRICNTFSTLKYLSSNFSAISKSYNTLFLKGTRQPDGVPLSCHGFCEYFQVKKVVYGLDIRT